MKRVNVAVIFQPKRLFHGRLTTDDRKTAELVGVL